MYFEEVDFSLRARRAVLAGAVLSLCTGMAILMIVGVDTNAEIYTIFV